jgi:hypothetical protein
MELSGKIAILRLPYFDSRESSPRDLSVRHRNGTRVLSMPVMPAPRFNERDLPAVSWKLLEKSDLTDGVASGFLLTLCGGQ